MLDFNFRTLVLFGALLLLVPETGAADVVTAQFRGIVDSPLPLAAGNDG